MNLYDGEVARYDIYVSFSFIVDLASRLCCWMIPRGVAFCDSCEFSLEPFVGWSSREYILLLIFMKEKWRKNEAVGSKNYVKPHISKHGVIIIIRSRVLCSGVCVGFQSYVWESCLAVWLRYILSYSSINSTYMFCHTSMMLLWFVTYIRRWSLILVRVYHRLFACFSWCWDSFERTESEGKDPSENVLMTLCWLPPRGRLIFSASFSFYLLWYFCTLFPLVYFCGSYVRAV